MTEDRLPLAELMAKAGLIPAALMNDRFLERESLRSAQRPSHRTGRQLGRLVLHALWTAAKRPSNCAA